MKKFKEFFYTFIIVMLLFVVSACVTKEYNVTFNLGYDNLIYGEKQVKKGDTLDQPDEPIREGYQFLNWQLENKEYDFGKKVAGNFTLTAQWEKTFIVKFFLGYGNSYLPQQVIIKGNKVEEPDEPINEGHLFLGWFIENEEYNFNREINENILLTAQWEEDPIKRFVTVTFNTNDEDLKTFQQTVLNGERLIIPSPPEKTGYKFLGWHLNDVLFDFNNVIKEDILLIGKWEETSDSFVTVTFNTNGGDLESFEQTIRKGDLIIDPTEPTKSGYKFIGWYLDDLKYNFNTPLESDIVLKAKWEELEIVETFFVVFDTRGGNYTPMMLNVEKGSVIEKPANPTLDGHLFLGWYYGEELFDFKEGILKDYLLVAKWLNINDNKLLISNFKNLENNSDAIITGVITSFNSFNYLTIEDESGAIAVLVEGYNMNNLRTLNFKKGNRVILQATKDVNLGLILAKTNINYLEKIDAVSPLPPSIDITSMNFNELYNYQSKLVDHDNLKIININETNDKLVFTLSNEEQTIEAIYNTKYLFEQYEYLYALRIGDIVEISQALLTWVNEPYLALGDVDEVIKTGEIEKPEGETFFQVFYLNDTHGAVMNDGNELGLAKIGNYIKKTKDENSIFLTGGDILQGQLISNSNKGALMMEVFNELDLDAFVIGNHEFDWGLDVVLEYFDPNTSGVKANFPILGANVKQDSNDQRPDFIDSHTIIQRGDYKIGIIGVIGDGLESSIARLRVKDYYFSDAYTAVKNTVDEIKNKVDFILVGNHGGNATFNQRVSELPKVAAVFNGHSHSEYTGKFGEVPYIQSGANGEYVGKVDLTFTKLNGLTLLNSKAENISRHPFLNKEDEAITTIINSYYNEISHLYTEVIIHAYETMSRTDLTYFVAKLMAKVTGSVFGFQNSGGTRADIERGPITGSDVFKVFPFDNQIISAEIKGSDLTNLQRRNTSGYLDIEISSINSDDYYRVATNDYLFYSLGNAEYFAPVYDQKIIHGDLYETFYNYLVDLKASGSYYFNIDSSISYSAPATHVFAYYDRSLVQVYN